MADQSFVSKRGKVLIYIPLDRNKKWFQTSLQEVAAR